MSYSFENQGTCTYLVYDIGKDDKLDTTTLGMLTNNKIPGLAETLFTQMDSTKYIKYNVSAKISVKQFFAGPVNKKRLLGVFSGIVDAMLSAEDYMIDCNSILLDLDYIFADVSTCETVLICLPIAAKIKIPDLGMFFKEIMFSTQFDQTENCDHVAKIINYLNSTPLFSLSDFKTLIKNLKGQGNAQTVNISSPVAQQTVQAAVPAQYSATPPQPYIPSPPATPPQPSIPNQPPNKKSKGERKSRRNKSEQVPQPTQVAANPDEEEVSFLYLMQHYNKERAALYKKQKAAKKVGKNAKSANPVNPDSSTNPNEEEISFLYLMQHYNKERAALYKNQKAAKKAAKGAAKSSAPPQMETQYKVPGAPPVNIPTPVLSAQSQASHNQPNTPVHQPTYQPQTSPQGQAMSFGETTVLGGGGFGETTVLNAGAQSNQMISPHLIRVKNNEKIVLDKPIYRIGKERSFVDYFIGDNTAISRSHANIITRDGECFVVDTNSTNHTYLNESMLQSNVENKVEHGAKIRLADEEFEFRLY